MYRLSKSIFFSLLFSILVVFFVHASALAQSIPGIAEPVTFNVIPQYPKPNETVTITTESFSTDLNKAVFKWTVNGKPYATGAGLKAINVQSGKTGSLLVINVEVSTPDFGIIRNNIALRPADVTLLWQSDTYVPPFYKGKALHSYNGSFKVTALPEFFDAKGKRINPKDLIYTWKKNGNVQGDVSGLGRDSFITSQTSYLRDGEDVSVDVSSPKDTLAGSASATVKPSIPEIILYENSPLYGVIYEQSQHNPMTMSAEEVSILAEPFYMSVSDPLNGYLSFDWKMNNAPLLDFRNRNQVTLRKSGTRGGSSDIHLGIQHKTKVLQGGSADITIIQ